MGRQVEQVMKSSPKPGAPVFSGRLTTHTHTTSSCGLQPFLQVQKLPHLPQRGWFALVTKKHGASSP